MEGSNLSDDIDNLRSDIVDGIDIQNKELENITQAFRRHTDLLEEMNMNKEMFNMFENELKNIASSIDSCGLIETLEDKFISDRQKEFYVIEKFGCDIYVNHKKTIKTLHEVLSEIGGNIVSTSSANNEIIWVIETNKKWTKRRKTNK
jgi:hypothetical protein